MQARGRPDAAQCYQTPLNFALAALRQERARDVTHQTKKKTKKPFAGNKRQNNSRYAVGVSLLRYVHKERVSLCRDVSS
jgi:hypothetical protein